MLKYYSKRDQAQIKFGERAGKARYKLCFPKANKRSVVKQINKKKSFQYLSGLLSDVVKRVELGNALAQRMPVRLPKNIASKPSPNYGRCNRTTLLKI